MQQLALFDDLKEIHEFPAGHIYHEGKFTLYTNIQISQKALTEAAAIAMLEQNIVQAVKVFLSGGVGSI